MNELESKPIEDDEPDDAIIGKAFIISGIVVLLLFIGTLAVVFFKLFANRETKQTEDVVLADLQVNIDESDYPFVEFVDITESAGIDFKHTSGAVGEKLLPETMGSGAAFFDFDNDGDQDLLLINSDLWPWDERYESTIPTHKLYANRGDGTFDDVTEKSGLTERMYGTGVAIGDIDNDGWTDLYITSVGSNRLYKNEQGVFKDVTSEAGVAGDQDRWSTSCCFFDMENDGDLDLFVCNYLQWNREIDLKQGFQLTGVGRAYGPPTAFAGTYPYLFRNDGDGKFTDVSNDSGVQIANPATGNPLAKSLGVVPKDYNDDGFTDLVVANDTVQNFLFINDGKGHFSDNGAQTGIAFDSAGNARGAMGIDAGFFRDQDTLGICIGNFSNEMSALYVRQNTGDPSLLLFTDDANSTGFGPPSRLLLTFGMFFFDYDLDGRLDILATNGHLEEDISQVQASQSYEQPPQLFWNAGSSSSREFLPVSTSEEIGVPALPGSKLSPLDEPIVGRGSAFADIDGDGDLDFVITTCGGAPKLIKNNQQLGHRWIRIKLIGKQCNRNAIGATVSVTTSDGIYRANVNPTKSYQSASELPLTFGLGYTNEVKKVEIVWPGGKKQSLDNLKIDQMHTIEEE